MSDHNPSSPKSGSAPAPMVIKSQRQIRTLRALLGGPISREQLDRVTGSSNSPDLVLRLRRKGLELPCTPTETTDRDGQTVHPGIYSLTAQDRPKAVHMLSSSEGLMPAPRGPRRTPVPGSATETPSAKAPACEIAPTEVFAGPSECGLLSRPHFLGT